MKILIYKYLHLSGVLLVFLSYGLLIARTMFAADNKAIRKLGGILSGIGLFLILLGGFGLLAAVYGNAITWWIGAKIVLWLALGGMLVLINRARNSMALFWTTLALGLVAAALGIFGPAMR